MGKIVKQDLQFSTTPVTAKEPTHSTKGKLGKGSPTGANGTSNRRTPIKEKSTPVKQPALVTNQKRAPVKEVMASKNAVVSDAAPPKPSDVARKQALEAGNPGKVPSVEARDLPAKNKAQTQMMPATKVEAETTVPVREAAATLEKRVASEMAEKEQIRSLASTESKDMENGENQQVNDSENKAVTDVEFCWDACRANSVKVTGSFNGWKEKLDMTKDGDAWKAVIPLEKGRHSYKFIVDGEWCYDMTRENEHDNDGNINNIVTV